jgi:beta-barrel assembly-enhancing protease
MKSRISLVVAATVIAVGTASAQFSKPSVDQQIDLGHKAATELRKTEKVLPSTDPRVQLVRRIGRRLLSSMAANEPWEYSFDVIQSKDVNAFALPGGPTFIYTGLLDKLKTEDELAGIMGHELTHVRRQHWAYAYRDSQQKSGLLVLGAVLFRVNRNVMNAANMAKNLIFDLPFSRKHETGADEGGFTLMTNSGFNPQGLADVFQMLRDQSKSGKSPEWLSDHPDDNRRIDHIRDLIRNGNKEYPASRPINIG